jgi:pSer/pThr/pTyr-binding forkhead associated (FHA) protein
MVQLKILSGKKAGSTYVARRFPVRIGRAPNAHLTLEESGVWDEHLVIHLNPGDGFNLQTQGQALASINAQSVQQAVLRNGDVIEFGSVKLQFWLDETRQVGLPVREAFTWTAIAIVFLGQLGLLYWLLR